MDKESLGKTLLRMVATTAATVTPGGVITKILLLVSQFLGFLKDLPKDDIDYFIDLVEKNNSNNTTVMAAMRVVRILLACPDEPGEDQKNPV